MEKEKLEYLSSVQMSRLSYEEKQKYLERVARNLASDSEDDLAFDDDDIDPEYIPANDVDDSDVELENVIAETRETTDSEADDEEDCNIDDNTDDNRDDLNQNDGNDSEYYIGKDGTKWRKLGPNLNRLLAHNVLREPLFMGPNPNTKNLNDVDTFCKLFDSSMQSIICRNTNKKAENQYKKYMEANPDIKKLVWEPLKEEELLAYLGLLIVIGAHKSNYEPTAELWKKNSFPLYRATMSVRRFYNITRFIRFDYYATRQARMETDKAAPITEIFQMLNANLKNNYRPHKSITIDEQLFPFRGRTKFTQYIPSKAAKYGIKIWWACDSETAYPLNGQIYTGKIGNIRDKNQGERVVKELIAPYKNSGRNVTTDNFLLPYHLQRIC